MNRNHVQLIGYVGADVAALTAVNGSRRACIRIATHYKKVVPGTEPIHTTVWHTIIAWDHIALLAEKMFVKGSKIMVEGPLDYHAFTRRDGSTQHQVRIIAHTLINLDR